jgi:hypothetical protein
MLQAGNLLRALKQNREASALGLLEVVLHSSAMDAAGVKHRVACQDVGCEGNTKCVAD